jgi:hypothetical protein
MLPVPHPRFYVCPFYLGTPFHALPMRLINDYIPILSALLLLASVRNTTWLLTTSRHHLTILGDDGDLSGCRRVHHVFDPARKD